MTYDIEVIETRAYQVTYRVEADSPEEAIEKAGTGDTVEEFDERFAEVIGDRDTANDTLREVGRLYCEFCPGVDGAGCCVCGNDLPTLTPAV